MGSRRPIWWTSSRDACNQAVNGCHINRDRTAAAIARNVESDCVTRPEFGYGRPVAAANPEGNIRGGAIYPDDDQTLISLETLDYRCGHGDTLCPRSCADQTKGDLSVKIRDGFCGRYSEAAAKAAPAGGSQTAGLAVPLASTSVARGRFSNHAFIEILCGHALFPLET
jgi:hypothetical protein